MEPARISLIIPCLNEEKHLQSLFASLDAQRVEGSEVEIIFVDGMSTDQTADMLREYAEKRPNVKVLKNPKKIVPCAMNLGIGASTGQLIMRIDAHTEYANDYVAKCLEHSERTGAQNVGGPVRAKATGRIGGAVRIAHHCRFGLGGGRHHDENFSGFVDTVFLGAFNRSIFDTPVGYYDERLVRNQDIELNSRIKTNGGKVFMSPEIRSAYKCRSTLGGLWKQNFLNGIWAVYTRAIAPRALSFRHFIPLAFVFALIMGLIALVVPGLSQTLRMVPVAAIFGSYLAASFFFSLAKASQEGIAYLFVLPIVFAVLHFSYGCGSLWGIATLRGWLDEGGAHHDSDKSAL